MSLLIHAVLLIFVLAATFLKHNISSPKFLPLTQSIPFLILLPKILLEKESYYDYQY